MITLATVKSSIIENGARILKVLQFGAKTVDECAPFGDDSNPIADMTAIYADTAEAGDQVIIGYINTKQLAAVGEKRMYSLKADKSISSYVWLKNDGSMELAGNAHNLVRYTPLNAGLQATITQLNAELSKIQIAISTLGGAYAKGTVTNDISASKINEIKSI